MTKLSGYGLAAALMTTSVLSAGVLTTDVARADQVFIQDVIVQGSLCTGVDCVNGEAFGFDTVVLKENNLRIYFNDTSASSSFPNVDWRLIANETVNGGQNMFAIEDSTSSTKPVWIQAGSPNNLLYLSSAGRIGVKTSAPAVDLHMRSGNSPALRLEQDGSGGFSQQVWDVAGNETNFFIRDVTNASRLPFKIVPSAPTNSLFVAASGNIGLGTATPDGSFHVANGAGTTDDFLVTSAGRVGIGTTSPEKALHVLSDDATGNVLIQDTSSSFGVQLELRKQGTPRMQFDDSSIANNIWNIGLDTNSNFIWTHFDNSGIQAFITPTGSMTIAGTLTQNSDRNKKTGIVRVDDDDILEKVARLDISEWAYKTDPSVIHIGPMAQDFHALFDTGVNDTSIATIDTSGVALASIKAINSRLREKERQVDQMEARIAELTRLVEEMRQAR